MTFGQLVWENKVKIMGVISAVLMQLMSMAASGQLDTVVSMAGITWIGIIGSILGVAITAAGFSNSSAVRMEQARAEVATAMKTALEAPPPPPAPPSASGGFVRLQMLPFVALFVFVASLFTACASTPIGVAQTLEQRAYAAYGTFVIIEEKAAELTGTSSKLSRRSQLQIINGIQSAQPVVDDLQKSLAAYETARADFEAQKIDQPAFQVVVNNLASWVKTAEPLIASLLSATRGK